ncbi:MAG: carboxypeptidase regulatory-like domain-containing protein, partial [Sediminibacterium sp.]
MNKFLHVIALVIICISTAFAQNGEIQGKVLDQKGEGIPFANVAVFKNGVLETGSVTDFDGNYIISGLSPGTYDVEASYQGNKYRVTDVVVSSGIVFMKDIVLQEGTLLDEIVISYEAPLVDKGNTSTGGVVTKEDIQKIATRNVSTIAATKEGVYQSDEGGGLSIKGSRSDATEFVIDGVRVSGSLKLPQDAIEQLQVITGGVDPKYGDATGGFISITTRGPSREYNGSVELGTSTFLDPYNYNLASVFFTGPIITTNKGQDDEMAKFGFFIAAEGEWDRDADPSAIGNYKVKDDVLNEITQNPLQPAVSGTGFNKSSEFLTFDDLENIDYKQNVNSGGISVTTRFDYKLSKTTNLQLGLTWRGFDAHNYVRTFALFNSDNNPVTDQNTYRGYLRFTQRFPERQNEKGERESVIGNAYYNIQVDYTKFMGSTMDETHGMNPFNYGYIGAFDTYRAPVYLYGTDAATGLNGWLLAGYADTAVQYTPGTLNPELSTYTTQYYNETL